MGGVIERSPLAISSGLLGALSLLQCLLTVVLLVVY